jgi:DNA transformation protein
MPAMRQDEIEEVFAGLGRVSVKRMFGGKGVFHQGLMVGVEFAGELLLKTDETSAPAFEAAGSRRWSYQRKGGKVIPMSYWTIPPDAFDDPDLMARWVRLAFEAALRAREK